MVVACRRSNEDKSHDGNDCHDDGLYDLSCDQNINIANQHFVLVKMNLLTFLA